MVEILAKPTETVVGKIARAKIESIQEVVEEILRDNKALRNLKYRHIVRLIVEDKLGKEVGDESVPRACRHIQNTLKKYEPEVEDERRVLEKVHKDYYGRS